jgi:hypothetical protein
VMLLTFLNLVIVTGIFVGIHLVQYKYAIFEDA